MALYLGSIATLVLAGTMAAVLPIFNMPGLAHLAPITTLFFLGACTYAILAKGLFDIRVFISKAIVFTALLTLVVTPFAALFLFLGDRFLASDTVVSYIPGGLTALGVGFAFEPLRQYAARWADGWLFRKDREREEILRALAQELNLTISLDEAADTIMHSMVHIFRLSRAVVYVFQQAEDTKELSVQSIRQTGYDSVARVALGRDDFCIEYFSKNGEILLRKELDLEIIREQNIIERRQLPENRSEREEFLRDHAIKSAVSRKMEYVRAEVAIPLQLAGQPIGLIFLPDRNQGYSPDDLRLLNLIGGQAVNSIQKTKLYEGDQMKNQFVSIASHELLTPIASIEGYLTLILNDKKAEAKLDDQTRGYLRNVRISTERLSALVRDILSVSRIEQGKIKIEPARLDICQAIQDTVSQLQFIAEDRGVKLIIADSVSKKQVPDVWADNDRTIQVLVNLVSNAIKYNRDEGGTVTLSAKLVEKDTKVEVTVKDNGIGMSKDQMAHLFEKFYRVDSPKTTGVIGTGLGLYITKAIIERMGGAIVVKSEEGKGTAFSFTLPVAHR